MSVKVKICQIASETSPEASSLRELEGKEAWIVTQNLSSSVYQTYEGGAIEGCTTLDQ